MNRRRWAPFTAIMVALALAGCATYEVGVYEEPTHETSEQHTSAPKGKAHGKLGIPPGHLPGPGECRVWFPGRPPGQQPPPHDCRGGRHAEVPPGAWLIEHSSNDPENVHVNVFDPEVSNRRLEIRIYNASTGVHISTRLPN